jgi:hypothetical protein
MAVLSAAAVSLPILSGLLLFQQKVSWLGPVYKTILASSFTSLLVAVSALALTFVILKFLLPKVHQALAAEQRKSGAQDTRSDAEIDYFWQKMSLGFAGVIFAVACGVSIAGAASFAFPVLSGACLMGLGAGLYIDRKRHAQAENALEDTGKQVGAGIGMQGAVERATTPSTQAVATNKVLKGRRGSRLFDRSEMPSSTSDESEGEDMSKNKSDSDNVQPP